MCVCLKLEVYKAQARENVVAFLARPRSIPLHLILAYPDPIQIALQHQRSAPGQPRGFPGLGTALKMHFIAASRDGGLSSSLSDREPVLIFLPAEASGPILRFPVDVGDLWFCFHPRRL